VNVAMAGATRAVSVGRGYDPRDFSLIAFGGAGPMHAVDIAAELEIPKILVPAVPGCLSALGLVVSDVTHDYVLTHLAPVTDELESDLDRLFKQLDSAAHADLKEEGIEPGRRELFRAVDMRYVGQQSSVSVPAEGAGVGWLAATASAFHALHERLYGFSVPDEPIEVVNVRLRAVGRLHRDRTEAVKLAGLPPRPEPMGTRKVGFGATKADRLDVPVYARAALLPGTHFSGPAIVEQTDSTLLIPPGKSVRADAHANLLMQAGSP
jgi:N-methylhydantoinase A